MYFTNINTENNNHLNIKYSQFVNFLTFHHEIWRLNELSRRQTLVLTVVEETSGTVVRRTVGPPSLHPGPGEVPREPAGVVLQSVTGSKEPLVGVYGAERPEP